MLPPNAADVKHEKCPIMVLRTWTHLLQLTSWINDWYTWWIDKDEVVDEKTRVVNLNDLAVGRPACPSAGPTCGHPSIRVNLSIAATHTIYLNDAMPGYSLHIDGLRSN